MSNTKDKSKGNYFADYLRTLTRHKFLIIIPLVAVFLGSVIFGSTLPKVYKASAVFRMLKPTSSTEQSRRRSPQDDLAVMTQLILNRPNLVEVIKKVRLDSRYSHLPELEKEAQEERLVRELRKNVTVQPKANDVYEVAYRHPDPKLAADVANSVTSGYIDRVVQEERDRMARKVSFLEGKVQEYQEKVRKSSEALQEFKAEHILDLPGTELSNSTELRNLRDDLSDAEGQLSDAQTAKSEIEKQIREIDSTVISETVVETNPAIAQYRSQLDQAELELNTLKARFTDLHPDVVKKKNEIESLKTLIAKATEKITTKETHETNPVLVNLQQELKNAHVRIASAERRKQQILAKIAECEKRVQNGPALEKEMAKLTEDDTLNKSLLETYTKKLEDARIEQEEEKGQKETIFQVLDFARTSSASAASNRLKVSLLGLLLGGGLGLGLAILREQMDTSFKHVQDAASFLDIPIVGTIPVINTAMEKAREKKRQALGWIFTGALVVVLGIVLVITSLTSFLGN